MEEKFDLTKYNNIDFLHRLDKEYDSPDLQQQEEFSSKQLKQLLKENFAKSGTLQVIKAKLRKEFIQNLTKKQLKTENAATATSLEDKILFSLIFHYLKKKSFYNSISVFLAESGLENERNIVTENDIVNMIRIGDLAKEMKKLLSFSSSVSSTASSSLIRPPSQVLKEEGATSTSSSSVLDGLCHYILHSSQGLQSREIATQTSLSSAKEEYLNQLKQLEITYSQQQQALNSNSSPFTLSVEEKLLSYREELDTRYKKELELSMKHFRENEISRIKHEESEKLRLSYQLAHDQLQHEYNTRFHNHLEREASSAKVLADNEKKFQQQLYDERQAMLQEINEIRAREELAKKKLDYESQGETVMLSFFFILSFLSFFLSSFLPSTLLLGLHLLELRMKDVENKLKRKETELEEKERNLENKSKINKEEIKKSLENEMKMEFDVIHQERMQLLNEKKRLREEQIEWQEKLDHLSSLKDALKKAKATILENEIHIESLNKEIILLKSKNSIEESNLMEVSYLCFFFYLFYNLLLNVFFLFSLSSRFLSCPGSDSPCLYFTFSFSPLSCFTIFHLNYLN
jgi:oral-facial-digital syndrome 1 protein